MTKLSKVLVLGSGALKIGQAGEFDYSGSQALKALREEGISSVLINPNIATIQTSEGIADKVYFLPVTPFFVTEIIKKERPDGILLAFGGQTALNCGTELYRKGILDEYGVKVLGTSVEAIMNTEDRDLFVKELNKVDLKVPVSEACEDIDSAVAAARRIGYPVMIRSAYALGGQGSGVCKTEEEFREIAESAFTFAPQVLVEESLKGWKEIEFECIRDAADRCFTVASMENFDPLGIHTGEIMSIGRSFEELIQKGLRMIGQGMHGFVCNEHVRFTNLDEELENPTDLRIFAIAQALQDGYPVERIHELTKIDPWFIGRMKNIVDFQHILEGFDSLESIPEETLRKAKEMGFSDFQIARCVLKSGENMERQVLKVRSRRKVLGILPAVKRIETVASEHPDLTNYLYMTYGASGHDVNYYKNDKSVIVLGSGAYRIGSSVEFDWCSVNAIQTARKLGYKSIMINYNPETVSTDYDMCDRLYFDELSFERVMDVIDLENPNGVIVSVGGQIPNNLAMKLYRQGVPVLGTSPVSIDRAENRNKFSAMLDQLGIDQPQWSALTSMEDVKTFIDKVGYPVLVRPSYVLSGAAMNVCHNDEELVRFLDMASEVSKDYPVVISQFMTETNEIEFDAVARNGEIVEYGISEHIEYAGVHSGDATMVFPAQNIRFATIRQIKKISRAIARELNISGPFNIQFLAKGREVKVIECNLRASRSFPFVSKVLKRNFIETATKIMLDAPYTMPDKSEFDIDRIGVKASQFSFSRLQNADPVLGVDMSSTGEVGCLGDDYSEALLNAMIATGYKIPSKDKGIMISSGDVKEKVALLDGVRLLKNAGYTIYGTCGTAAFLNANGVEAIPVDWPDENNPDNGNVIRMIADHMFDLIINIPKNRTKRELTNGYHIRRAAIDHNIPLITNSRLASAFMDAITEKSLADIKIKSWQEYE